AKAQNIQKQVEQADGQYKANISEHQQLQKRYEEDMKNILQQFQQLDEKRTVFIGDCMSKYLLAQESLVSGLQQSILTLKQKVEQIDPLGDIQQFLEDKQTNAKPSQLVDYEPYNPAVRSILDRI